MNTNKNFSKKEKVLFQIQSRIPKRQPMKTIVAYVEAAADGIRNVIIWTLDPISIEYDKRPFKSGEVITSKVETKVVMQKAEYFIKEMSMGKSKDLKPNLIVWDKSQLNILLEHIVDLPKHINYYTLLQERCRDIFRYDLSCQNFSIQEISEKMGIEEEDVRIKFAKIALKTEREFMKLSKELRKSNTGSN